MALEVSLILCKQHDHGTKALPDLVQHHSQQISAIIQGMLDNPEYADEVNLWREWIKMKESYGGELT